MRIGIFGGSFNPIHNGHLILARFATHELHLDKIIFVPTYKPPKSYKEIGIKLKHRVKMLELALSENLFNGEISYFEVETPKVSYTINTLKFLKSKYKKDELFLIMGADTIYTIDKWKDSAKIKKLAKVCIAYYNFYCPMIEIRSSLVRWLRRTYRPIKQLVPDNVLEYITKNNLYRK